MPTGGTPTGFNISDFLTRVIPGGIIVLSVTFLVFGVELLSIESIPSASVVAFAIASFVVGELINTLRISFFDVPNHFRRVLYSETEDEMYLGLIDRYTKALDADGVKGYSLFEHSDADVIPTLRNRFDLDDEFDGAHNFYTLLMSDISSERSPETTRLKNIYIFYQNLKITISLSIAWYSLSIILILVGVIEQTDLRTALGFLIVYLLVFLLYIILISFKFLASTDRVYVESLLSDYFTTIRKSG